MSKQIVAVLDCGHTKIVILRREGDVFTEGLKMYCMDCDEVCVVVDVR